MEPQKSDTSSKGLSLVQGRKKESQIPNFETLSNELNEVIIQTARAWRYIQRWQSIFDNEESGENVPSLLNKKKRRGLFETYNKRWITFRMSIDLYRVIFLSPDPDERTKQKLLNNIKQLDSEYWGKIAAFAPKEEILIFQKLLAILYSNPPIASAFIKTHYDELIRASERIKDRKRAEKIRESIVKLSSREEDELLRCINDVNRWQYRTDRASYGTKLFIERTYLFLNGGKSKYDGQGFLGFKLHFQDRELGNSLLRDRHIRRLMTYQQEVAWFRWLVSAMRRSETEGKWEEFYQFYDNLDKGKNYIKMVRETFGNDEFAKILEEFKQKKHEALIEWEKELRVLEARLNDPAYADRVVVSSASQSLILIFDQRMKSLSEDKGKASEELKTELAKSQGWNKLQFQKALARRRIQLREETERERIEFEAVSMDAAIAIDRLENMMNGLREFFSGNREIDYERSIVQSSLKWRKFMYPELMRLLRFQQDITKTRGVVENLITRAEFGMEASIKLADQELRIKGELENKPLDSTTRMLETIKFAKSINPKINRCISHIEKRLANYIVESDLNKNEGGQQLAA